MRLGIHPEVGLSPLCFICWVQAQRKQRARLRQVRLCWETGVYSAAGKELKGMQGGKEGRKEGGKGGGRNPLHSPRHQS